MTVVLEFSLRACRLFLCYTKTTYVGRNAVKTDEAIISRFHITIVGYHKKVNSFLNKHKEDYVSETGES